LHAAGDINRVNLPTHLGDEPERKNIPLFMKAAPCMNWPTRTV